MEKANLKAEYKRIMNEQSNERKEVTDSSATSSVSTKRKRDGKEKRIIEVGMRVKVKFEDGEYYEGNVTKVKRGKGGDVVKIGVEYDDGEEEECNWPDDDIVISGRELMGEKKTKKKKRIREIKVVERKLEELKEGGLISMRTEKEFFVAVLVDAITRLRQPVISRVIKL